MWNLVTLILLSAKPNQLSSAQLNLEFNSIPSNKLTYVRGDLSDIKDVRRAFAAAGSNAKVECAFHIPENDAQSHQHT